MKKYLKNPNRSAMLGSIWILHTIFLLSVIHNQTVSVATHSCTSNIIAHSSTISKYSQYYWLLNYYKS